jgi:MFS family permease
MSPGEPVFDEKNFSIFTFRPVLLLWTARVTTAVAWQMMTVAVGWQVYELTSSAMLLGVVGLMQFIPAAALVLVAGHIVDLYNRKTIVRLAQAVMAFGVGVLAVSTATETISTDLILAAVFLLGGARSFEATSMQTIPPAIVPPAVLPRAIAGLSTATQAATIAGPAVGGVMLLLGPTLVYTTCCILFVVASVLISMLHMVRVPVKREPLTFDALFAGIRFVRNNPIVLGAMSLDLFATVFGGATALYPIFARDIFEVGPAGLGAMRVAPAIGAIAISLIIARWPLHRDVGRTMYIAIAAFGIATIVFALSTSFTLALIALAVTGAGDMLSIVIRQPLIQLETPDAMRGRVSAVNSLFIGTSNQIGEFRAGVTAAWLGTVPAVLIGGIGTLLVVAVFIKVFPVLYRVNNFEQRYR